jgi:adhesin transport system outer membrane protein
MPINRKPKMAITAVAAMPMLVACLFIAGCSGKSEVPAMAAMGQDPTAPAGAYNALAPQKGLPSQLIANLQARQSVLPVSGVYQQIAQSVLQTSNGTAAVELRMARLMSEARSKNWMPSIGPSVSLTSLSGLVAGLVLEQGLLDNGRRKGERMFAAADVEVAAVVYSTDINTRIYDGLSLYVTAQQARAKGAVSVKAQARLAEFQSIMARRVAGGISDLSEEQVISQRLAEMQATLALDQETERAALAQLASFAEPLGDQMRGLDSLDVAAPVGLETLHVLRARAEGAREMASADIAMAEMMPWIGASAGLDAQGIKPGLNLNGLGILAPGSASRMEALASTPDLVIRRIAQATMDSDRHILALEQQILALQTRQTQGAIVTEQMSANMALFTEQYQLGRRTLLELVGQYDAYARMERDQVSLRFEIALLELQIARDRGVLVSGAQL